MVLVCKGKIENLLRDIFNALQLDARKEFIFKQLLQSHGVVCWSIKNSSQDLKERLSMLVRTFEEKNYLCNFCRTFFWNNKIPFFRKNIGISEEKDM